MGLQQLHNRDESLFSAFAESRIGGRPENQDSYGFAETPWGFLVTVCDGMGGGPGGKTASSIAVREIIDGVNNASEDEEKPNVLIKAIRQANMAIIEAGNEEPSLKGMGSTTTVLLISERSALVAYVGDSRVYQLRGRKKIYRTFDHSMVFDLVKQHVITEEQARLSSQSNIITRALGVKPDVEVDVQELAFEKGDRFVLCSDGIHGVMPEKELIKMLSLKKPVGAVTDQVATYVDNQGRLEGSGYDNLTIVMLEMKKNSIIKPLMSKKAKSVIVVLAVICIISILANVAQLTKYCQVCENMVPRDSLLGFQKQDSLQKDSIKLLKKKMLNVESKLKEIDNTLNN